MPYIYNPDDEPDECTFNGHVYKFAGETATAVPSEAIADHALTYLSRWGFVRLDKPLKAGKPQGQADSAAVANGRAIYLRATLEWAERHILAHHKANQPRATAGLPERPPSQDMVTAKKWLEAHDKELRKEGLIA